MYVSEIVNITLRTGKGTDHKIIEMIRSGQNVEVLDSDVDWTKVRTASGNEGWVLTRLLTDETPKAIQLAALRKEYDEMVARVKDPLEAIQTLESENARLKQQIAETEETLQVLNASMVDLRKKTALLSQMEHDYQNAQTGLAEMKQDRDQMEEALARLQRQHIFRWFLAGAGVLLTGFVIGIWSRPKRRRSSLL